MLRLLPILLLVACQTETTLDPAPPAELPHLALTIDAPAPASWHAVGDVQVSGTFDNLAGVSVLHAEQTTVGDGTFSATEQAVRGIHLVHAVGTGEDGTQYATHNAIMAGPTADPAVPVPDALRLRINNPGLNLVLNTVEKQITGDTIEPVLLAANPVYNNVDGDLSVRADVTRFGLSQTELELRPNDGYAELKVRLWDMAIGVDVDARKGGFTAKPSQTITANKVEMTAKVTLDVVDGELKVLMSDATIEVDGFGFDDSAWPDWLKGSFTDSIFETLIENALQGILDDTVPALLEEKLKEFSLSFETTLMERNIGVTALPNSAAFDPNGVQLGTHMQVQVSGDVRDDAPVYLSSAPAVPALDLWADMSVGLSDDLLNRVLFEAWRANLLTYELTTDDGSLPAYVLDLVGGNRQGRIAVHANLPPAIVQAEDHLQAQLGEIRVLVETPEGEYGERVDLAVGGTIDLDLQVIDSALNLNFGDKVVHMVVRETDWSSDIPRVTDQVAGILPLEAALNILDDMQIPLPSAAGLALGTARTERDVSTTHTLIIADLNEVDD